MHKKTETNTSTITKVFGKTEQKTTNLWILFLCYILAFFALILFKINSQPTSNSISDASKALEIKFTLFASPFFISELAVLTSLIAFPLFGVWILLQHTVFKKLNYNAKTIKYTRCIIILLMIILVLFLVIQATKC